MPNLWIPMTPVPKERPRLNRKTGVVYTPKRTLLAEGLVRQAWRDAEFPKMTGPLYINVGVKAEGFQIYMDGAPFYRSRGGLRGDIDNYLKVVMDGLQGAAFDNDNQIIAAEVWFDA